MVSAAIVHDLTFDMSFYFRQQLVDPVHQARRGFGEIVEETAPHPLAEVMGVWRNKVPVTIRVPLIGLERGRAQAVVCQLGVTLHLEKFECGSVL